MNNVRIANDKTDFKSNETKGEQAEPKINKDALARQYAFAIVDEYKPAYLNGIFYTYDTDHYREITDPESMIRQWFQINRIPVSQGLQNNTFAEVKALATKTGKAPFWMGTAAPIGKTERHIDDTKFPNAKLFTPFRNGLFNNATDELIPHTSSYFQVWCLPFDYDPSAVCPQWLKFLDTTIDKESQSLLQEWFGYVLSGDISRQKFMMLCGLPRSGKGTISRILGMVMGEENVAATTLDRLIDRFSTSALANSPLALIGEVEIEARNRIVILERFKQYTGNDPVPIERKGKDIQGSMVLPTRFTICCNGMPHFYDTSGALAERMLLIKFNTSFAGREDFGLLDNLSSELAGIAIWAMTGYKRLKQNGWTKSDAMIEEKKAFRRDSSSELAFLQDCCAVRKDWQTVLLVDVEGYEPLNPEKEYTTTQDLKKVYDDWTLENRLADGYKHLFRKLREMIPNLPLKLPQKRLPNGEVVRLVYGIKIKS